MTVTLTTGTNGCRITLAWLISVDTGINRTTCTFILPLEVSMKGGRVQSAAYFASFPLSAKPR